MSTAEVLADAFDWLKYFQERAGVYNMSREDRQRLDSLVEEVRRECLLQRGKL